MHHSRDILVVEDDDVDYEMLVRGFSKIGTEERLHRARDGVEALDFMTGSGQDGINPSPLVILLDINMPRMNGIEFLSKLRKTDGIQDAPVFVFTTSSSPRDIKDAYQHYANGYFIKPDTMAEMNSMLETLKNFIHTCQFPER